MYGYITSPSKSVKLCITQNGVLMQLVQGCTWLQGGAGSIPVLVHVPKPRALHTGNILSPLAVSEGLVKRFGTAQSGIQGAVIYQLTKWMVFNIQCIQNYQKIK